MILKRHGQSLVAAAALALSPPSPAQSLLHGRTVTPPELQLLDDDALELLARLEFPAPGDPELPAHERARALAAREALPARYQMPDVGPDPESWRLLSRAFLRLSPDQEAAMIRDLAAFEEESGAMLVRQLRRARFILDRAAVLDARNRLQDPGFDPVSDSDRAAPSRAHGIVLDAAVAHADRRAERIMAAAAFLDESQHDDLVLVAGAETQHQLGKLHARLRRAAAFNPAYELARFLDGRGETAGNTSSAGLRSELLIAVTRRAAACRELLRAQAQRHAATADYHPASARSRAEADDDARAAYDQALDAVADARQRLVAVNRDAVAGIARALPSEAGRAFHRMYLCTIQDWMARLWPLEFEDALTTVLEAEDMPPAARREAAQAAMRVDAAMTRLSKSVLSVTLQGDRSVVSVWKELPDIRRRLGAQYLESQRTVEECVQLLLESATPMQGHRDAPGHPDTSLAAALATATAARIDAEQLLQAGDLSWTRGAIPMSRVRQWQRPGHPEWTDPDLSPGAATR